MKKSERENRVAENANEESSQALNKIDTVNDSSVALSTVEYNSKSIPKEILSKAEGEIVASASFTDSYGRNHIIISERDIAPSAGVYAGKELFGYHFVEGGNSKLLWKIYDFVKDCDLDLTLEYIPNSLSITDLDRNGTAESIFLYKMSCKGDVSPDDLKLMMHEGSKKYAIRGYMDLDVKGLSYEKGEMKPDASIDSAPMVFREHAVAEWKRFCTQKLGY